MNHTLAIYRFIYYDCLSCFIFEIEIYYTIRVVYDLGKKVSKSKIKLIFHCHIDNPFCTLSGFLLGFVICFKVVLLLCWLSIVALISQYPV